MSQPRRAPLVKHSYFATLRDASGLISGPGWPSRPNLSVCDGELASTVVFALQPLELSRERFFDESRHRVLLRPAIEHCDGILDSHQQFARNGDSRSLDLPTRLTARCLLVLDDLAPRPSHSIGQLTKLSR